MQHHDLLTLTNRVIARTPARLGINAEILTHADRINLWDWLADSGAQAVRAFHPEVRPRRRVLPADAWPVRDQAGFAAWRQQVLDTPRGAHLHWDELRFDETIPWMGCPNAFVPRIIASGPVVVASCGWAPHDAEGPLVRDPLAADPAADDNIHWPAAASCYDAWFGTVYHLAERFGVRNFLTLNEPENRFRWWRLPSELTSLGDDWWMRIFRGPDHALSDLYLRHIAGQYAAIARIARMAVDDVKRLLDCRDLRLYGPTTVCWHSCWEVAAPYLDGLDWHHYHPQESTFRAKWPSVAQAAERHGKTVAMTEYNRLAGGTGTGATLFDPVNSLEALDLLLTTLSLSGPADPPLELACFYLLHFPSTHRNHKHLLYGSLDLADWSGRDKPLWDRGSDFAHSEFAPTAEELCIRHATPGYHAYRMALRAAGSFGGGPGPHPVLAVGQDNPSSSGPEDLHAGLRMLAVDQGERLVLTILNRTTQAAERVCLDCGTLRPRFSLAVERRVSAEDQDTCLAWHEDLDTLSVRVPAQSAVQLILLPWRAADIEPLRLEDAGLCGSRLPDLGLWQTTRLRAIARVDDREVDVSDLCVIWTSSHPDLLHAGSGGLVQRRRLSPVAITLCARLPDGRCWEIQHAARGESNPVI